MATLRYLPLGPLLAGGTSRAYLGLELADDLPPKPVALLWVPAEISDDGEQMGKLARETHRATLLEHPHLVRVYGLAALDDGMARVVELIDGEGLSRFLERVERLPSALAARVCAEAALGVHYAHEAGNEDGTPLVHGDLRPETVYVDYQGVTKVGGYGALAVAPKEENGRRVVNRRVYAAPEQLLGGRDAVNRQTDVYLLGALLYRCLTGAAPFEGTEKFEEAVTTAPLPEFPPSDDPLMQRLRPVVERAMAKRGADRFPSARAFHDALIEAVPELPGRETLAAFLENQFPPDDEVRAARREMLARGLAEARGAQTAPPVAEAVATIDPGAIPVAAIPVAVPTTVTPPEPAFSSEEPDSDAPGAPVTARESDGFYKLDKPFKLTPEPTPVVDAPRPSQPRFASLDNEPFEPSYSSYRVAVKNAGARKLSVALAVALGLLVIAGVFLLRRPRKSSSPEARPPAAEAPAAPQAAPTATATPSSTGSAPVGASPATASTAPPRLPPPEPAPPPSAAPSPTPAPQPTPPMGVVPKPVAQVKPASGTAGILDLSVEPSVEVFEGEASLGRTPLKISLSAGRHTLRFKAEDKGIDTVRNVDIKANRENEERVRVGKGQVQLTAPEGARVEVDGRKIGTAPLNPFPVYEGNHKIVVYVGKAKWQQPFRLQPGEKMYFTVERQ